MSPTKRMALTSDELSAIMKIAGQMVIADGKIEANEDLLLKMALRYFIASDVDKGKSILLRSKEMNNSQAIELISNLNEKQKKFVFSFYTTIMLSDEDVNANEMILLSFITSVCKLPLMKPEDAVCYFKEAITE